MAVRKPHERRADRAIPGLFRKFELYAARVVKAELFEYSLPDERIAKHPPDLRDGGRMLVLEGERITHASVRELPSWVAAGALFVFNDTRVRRARIFGVRPSGGRVEFLMLGPSRAREGTRERWRALGRASKALLPGARVRALDLAIEVIGKEPDNGVLDLQIESAEPVEVVLERAGEVPIPPYLGRDAEALDLERYQTVYARRTASVAAPTAGLHFTEALLEALGDRGVCVARLELEVGIGTFRPVTADDLDQHPMHEEHFVIGPELVQAIQEAREREAPVVAVGTTVVRALESARDPARPGHVLAGARSTRLLIQPGYSFSVVDGLFTNFHQPRSTLLALVAAFAGYSETMAAYRAALGADYRFLSYGDAMWIPQRKA
ncbi:MAG TPA: tRNA preQ1(34) S-adenosylmethionine ribosyltransferase-isomerase QueA [Polyangiaceae bacterium]|nr:tRNA preQ1(34) S-adenosylmethionine ribosyltransferase-isomerase QueA [Polyangiaceae bacterium]